MPVRDMTQAQFDAALAKHGMQRTGFMGYVTVYRSARGSTSVYPGNAGTRRRAQLAYLLRERDKAEAEHKRALAARAAATQPKDTP